MKVYFTIRVDLNGKKESFLKPWPFCFSGGRYCSYHQGSQSNEMMNHTLRLICIRNQYGVDSLINFMIGLKEIVDAETVNIDGMD